MGNRSQMFLHGGTKGAVQQGPVDILSSSITITDMPGTFGENFDDDSGGSELTKRMTGNLSIALNLNTSDQNKGETIQGYYVRFTKLIKWDLRNIKNGPCPGHALVYGLRMRKTMTGDCSKIMNFVEKFIGVSQILENDHLGAIMGYGDYVQFCDYDLEVAFRMHSALIRVINGTDILKVVMAPICTRFRLMIDDVFSDMLAVQSFQGPNSGCGHVALNHLNFGTINDLARKDLVRGLPRLKFEKYHLCSACQLGKSKKALREKIHLSHVDDYSRFTWVKFLRSKDETPEFVTNFLKQIQVGLNKTVRFIRTDNGTEFVNQVMSEYYEGVGIFFIKKSVEKLSNKWTLFERRNRYTSGSSSANDDLIESSMFLGRSCSHCFENLVNGSCLAQFRTRAYNDDPGNSIRARSNDKELEMPLGIIHCQRANQEHDHLTRWMSKMLFWNGDLQEELFVSVQPEGFEDRISYNVYRMKMALMG
ncbi:retrovirus-related pol polyprotein from transposon TNT 1-94 [Tanacetum coccineum]